MDRNAEPEEKFTSVKLEERLSWEKKTSVFIWKEMIPMLSWMIRIPMLSWKEKDTRQNKTGRKGCKSWAARKW
jgi:hypothetical protein